MGFRATSRFSYMLFVCFRDSRGFSCVTTKFEFRRGGLVSWALDMVPDMVPDLLERVLMYGPLSCMGYIRVYKGSPLRALGIP